MTFTQATILGAIQGLTEFLPVSSSGHLVIFQNLFGMKTPELIFDISVHLGTLAAVFVFFSKDILSIIRSLLIFAFRGKKAAEARPKAMDDIRLALMIIAASVPTGVLGLILEKKADVLFASLILVGFMLIATGAWMWFTKKAREHGPGLSLKNVLLIGLAQGIAVIPGISRSGSTIAAGLYLGLDRESATRFSFLISIPAILGAALLSVLHAPPPGTANTAVIITGAVTAFITGYAALNMLVYMVKRGKLFLFSPYCCLAGATALVMAWLS
ncbi:MAG: undecaprenyl-diphosphate phosphatase [Deltaproteobacteria bacterium]|nr:undecaprenyl-diphosphate phosphatase [Deltaproteobacteria bacterium]